MSEVISFRLNPDHTQEFQALKILVSWKQKGYSNRQVLTEALLSLGDYRDHRSVQQSIKSLNEDVDRLIELVEQITPGSFQGNINDINRENHPGKLPDMLITAIKLSVKPGLKVAEDLED